MEFENLKAETELANFNVAKKDQRYWIEVGKFIATWSGHAIAIITRYQKPRFSGRVRRTNYAQDEAEVAKRSDE